VLLRNSFLLPALLAPNGRSATLAIASWFDIERPVGAIYRSAALLAEGV
jgi:hypothetical protein